MDTLKYNPLLFSGSIVLAFSDSTIDDDKKLLDKIAKQNKSYLGNSCYYYFYGSLILLINPTSEDLKSLQQLFNDGGKGFKPLTLDNQPE